MAGALSLPCHQGDVEYAFEQLESGSFVASVSVAALERPIAGYPELKKAGSGKIGADPGGRVANSSSNRRPDGSCVTEGSWLTRAIQNRPLMGSQRGLYYLAYFGLFGL